MLTRESPRVLMLSANVVVSAVDIGRKFLSCWNENVEGCVYSRPDSISMFCFNRAEPGIEIRSDRLSSRHIT